MPEKNVEATPKTELVFEAEELVQNSKVLFGVKPEIARTALELARLETCTKAQAQTAIKKLLERKVK